MDTETVKVFLAIAAIIFIGFFGNLIFARFRVPDVLLLIALGMVIGPDILGGTFNLVTTGTLDRIDDYRDLFLTAALVLILFDGGLNLNIKSVMQSMRLATFTTVLTLLLEIVTVALILYFFMDMDILLALVVGTIIGGTGEAVVIPIVNKMRIRDETKAMLVMESVISDVLVIVVAISLMSLIALGHFDAVDVVGELMIKFTVGGAIGFIAGIAWLFVLQRLQNQPLSYMITVAALFLVAGLVEIDPINSSSAVAALMFGLAVGNRKFVKRWLTSVTLRLSTDEHIQEFHSEISFFVRTFFYVYLGLLFRFSTFELVHLVLGIGIIVVIVIVRRGTSLLAANLGNLEKEDADAMFAMMPRGLAAAVLATMPVALLSNVEGIWEESYAQLILNVVLIVILGTTIIATVLSFVTERKIDLRERKALRKRLSEAS
jgi:cell volume regulation protein A